MTWTRRFGLGLGLALCAYSASAQAQTSPYAPASVAQPLRLSNSPYIVAQPAPAAPAAQPPAAMPKADQPMNPMAPQAPGIETREAAPPAEAAPAPAEPSFGPTPLLDVKILQNAIFPEDSKIHIAGWMDFDYTYRSTGPGQNNVAPVMNRYGDELLARQLGLYLFKPTDTKCLDWGFNAIFIAGADASFLTPTAGGWNNTNPRFGGDFTDLNLTAHLPILTDGGVDIKAGRQTTCLGPMGALAWQRPFNSSDYAWYNLEEGRYTGVSANWIISKRLSWYNGIEIGGWGVFFDTPVKSGIGCDYLGQINYWLDEEAKITKVWATVLTGPTGHFSNGDSTTVELGLQHNYNKCLYQILDFQATFSKAGIFTPPIPGYDENAYDIYTVIGYHLTEKVDLNSRFEVYRDQNGLGYPGGFGNGLSTDYYEGTVGLDYHPVKWLQFRPEVRYDHASNPNFGENYDKKSQLSISADVLLKF